MLADELLPDPHVSLVRSIAVDADAETTYEAVPRARIRDDPLLGAIGWLRTLPERLLDLFESTPPEPDEDPAETLGEVLERAHCRRLAEDPGNELVVGLTGRFWDPREPNLAAPDAEAFRAFDEPGHAKGLVDVSVHERGPDRCLLVLELRASGTDPAARQALTRFSSLLKSAAGLVAHRALQAVKATAEAGEEETGRLPEPSRTELAAAASPAATLDDLDVEGRRVVLHADLGTQDGSLDHAASTLRTLLDRGAGVLVLGHRSLHEGTQHLETLGGELADRLDRDVVVLGDVGDAPDAAGKLSPGEILLAEHELPDGTDGSPAGREPAWVADLAEQVDAFVNDAFSISHRDPITPGLAPRIPGAAGPALVRELGALDRLGRQDEPRVAVLGGQAIPASLDALGHLLATNDLDEVLAGGLVGQVFLEADGVDTGEGTRSVLRDHGALEQLKRARSLLDAYRSQIHLPEDVAIRRDGGPLDVPVDDPPAQGRIRDVGPDTVNAFSALVDDAGGVLVHGPMGVVEEGYDQGTHGVLHAAGRADAYAVAAGGSTVDAIEAEGVPREGFDHVSRAGRAGLAYLAGETGPGLVGLRPSP